MAGVPGYEDVGDARHGRTGYHMACLCTCLRVPPPRICGRIIVRALHFAWRRNVHFHALPLPACLPATPTMPYSIVSRRRVCLHRHCTSHLCCCCHLHCTAWKNLPACHQERGGPGGGGGGGEDHLISYVPACQLSPSSSISGRSPPSSCHLHIILHLSIACCMHGMPPSSWV